MSGDGKKISFSFSKVKKSALVKNVNVEPKEKVEYVDCFDGAKGTFSFKGNVKNDNEPKKELIIPLVSSKSSSDIVKSRIDEKAKKNNQSSEVNGSHNANENKASKNLDELAAQEILKEAGNIKGDGKDANKLVIEANALAEGNESSEFDIDYDSVPVTDFGMAMLRGMGWKPNSGIGKEPKIVPTVSPKLRPKGLGLGAKPVPETTEKEEEPKGTKKK